MALFRSTKDISFVKRVTRELVENLLAEKVTYYPISKKNSERNLYGEAQAKIFDPPIDVYCLVEWQEQDVTNTRFGIDIVYNLRMLMLDEYLEKIELKPTEGDMVNYDDRQFEITKIIDPKLYFSKAGENIGRELFATSVRANNFNPIVSGTVEIPKRTSPDGPRKIDVFYNNIKFPFSGSGL